MGACQTKPFVGLKVIFCVEACEGIKHSECEELAGQYAKQVQIPLICAVVEDESSHYVKFHFECKRHARIKCTKP